MMIRLPDELRSSRVGSASASGNNEESDGPIARTITLFDCVPVIINPPIRALSPVSTRKRVEIFPKTLGGVGLGLPPGVVVAVAVAVGVAVGVTAAVAVAVAVAVGVVVAVAVGVPVVVGEGDGVPTTYVTVN